jgi:hypothetical protein
MLAPLSESVIEKFIKNAWAAQLVDYVHKLDSNDKGARQIKTEAMRNMGSFRIA